jgi:Spy/CpxP family protein refolding chaperone
MHPGFYYRWKRSQQGRDEQASVSACGQGGRRSRRGEDRKMYASRHGGEFGVRRPLRYMSHQLDLDDEQVDTLAAILNVLKTERAQARLDERRSIAGIADAVEGEAFDATAAAEAVSLRVAAAERLKQQVLETLEKTHAMLDPEQRKRLAYLLRSGQLTI